MDLLTNHPLVVQLPPHLPFNTQGNSEYWLAISRWEEVAIPSPTDRSNYYLDMDLQLKQWQQGPHKSEGRGASPLGSTIYMEGKPAKVLGRPAKTDVRSYVLGASPMPSSIIICRLRTTVSLLVSKTSDSGSNPLACAN